MEEAHEFLKRLENKGPFPFFTSCCPGWINLIEKVLSFGPKVYKREAHPHEGPTYPRALSTLSTCKSPQGMMSALIKRYFAKKIGKSPEDIIVVSVMPCVAKKDEIARPQLSIKVGDQTIPETDFSLTTRELAQLIKSEHVRFLTPR